MTDGPQAGGLSDAASLAAALLAIDPVGLGGLSLRARHGAERSNYLARLRRMLPHGTPERRLPMTIADEGLMGGLDLAATLNAGRPVVQRGLLADCDGGILTVPMAERLPATLAAKLALTMDKGAVVLERDGLAARHPSAFGLILLDEGIEPDEGPPACLLDRIAFHVAPAEWPSERDSTAPTPHDIASARQRLSFIEVGDPVIEALCEAAAALGIGSVRAPRLALAAARAAAALFGRDRIGEEDAALAARLVLAPRAAALPPEAEPPAESQAQDPEETADGPEQESPQSDDGSGRAVPENLVVAAARAAIPPDLLARLGAGQTAARGGTGRGRAGPRRSAAGRGRPVGARRGSPRAGQRLSLVETLRAAAPWQTIRRRASESGAAAARAPILVRPDDFRIVRTKDHPRATTIFVVDASGSAALNRLAEAKGAVELLLADCYIRRDSVALIAFSGRDAELLLPPTRSLARAKRCLSGFPAGGGTPLAAAIESAAALAHGEARKGQTPAIVFLTDGRGNVARDGATGPEPARGDALAAARDLAAQGTASLLIDISPRARPQGRTLADAMDGRYIALPHADAASLSGAIQTASGRAVGR
ncbi:MAG: magnesium chelatase subunit D [Kiloniellales bacterium]|nr:magnesium chelatase subunit D [Kiloniellales bacterium]